MGSVFCLLLSLSLSLYVLSRRKLQDTLMVLKMMRVLSPEALHWWCGHTVVITCCWGIESMCHSFLEGQLSVVGNST